MRDGLARTAALTAPTGYLSLFGGYSSAERFSATAEAGLRPFGPFSVFAFGRWSQTAGPSTGAGVRYDF